MAKITLSSIRDAAERKYGTHTIDLEDGKSPVELLHPISLSDEKRAALTALSTKGEDDESDESEAEVIGRLVDIIRVVTATEDQLDRLLAVASPRGYLDLGIISEIVTGYMEAQKVGEASPSQD